MNLKEKIEIKRKEMIDLASEKGFTDPEVVKVSQELDDLINESMKKELFVGQA